MSVPNTLTVPSPILTLDFDLVILQGTGFYNARTNYNLNLMRIEGCLFFSNLP